MTRTRTDESGDRPRTRRGKADAGVRASVGRPYGGALAVWLLAGLSACRFGYEVLPASDSQAADGGPPAFPRPDAKLYGEASEPPGSDTAPTTSDAAPEGGVDASAADAGPADCEASDPCSCGVLGGHRYRFCSTFVNFAQAESDCEAHGMQLVRIDDDEENAWLNQGFASVFSGLTFAFIGASDQSQEGAWSWLRGDAVFWNGDSGGNAVPGFYSHWDVNKPFGNTTRNCAGMLANGRWEDRSCTGENAYICESP